MTPRAIAAKILSPRAVPARTTALLRVPRALRRRLGCLARRLDADEDDEDEERAVIVGEGALDSLFLLPEPRPDISSI